MRAALSGNFVGVALLAALAFQIAPLALGQQDEGKQDPIEVGLTEQVEVELVLVDFLVVDNQGRNVPGLTADNFALKVAGRKTPIHSVDVDCRPVDRDTAGRRDETAIPDTAPEEPRRIILVFDYFHIENVAETLDRAMQMLDRWPRGNEIHTVISLGRAVRVEAPPTRDLGDVRWAIQRMRSDPDLYADNLTSLTQYRFFDRMKALFDLVEQTEGRKSIVLFSGQFQPDSFLYDSEYTVLSGLSTTTRASIYPVDTGGLRTMPTGLVPSEPLEQGLGGPAELRRLANATGGRVTADVNDIGVAYARAHNDLGCTYTLGFYNTQPRLDKKRRLTIKVKRPNMRVVYPEFYLQRSPEEKRKSMYQTAAMAPHMFEDDQVSTDLFVMGPASPEKWRAVMAVEVQLNHGESGKPVELRGFLRKPNGTIVHNFKKKIPRSAGTVPEKVTLYQDLDVEPGRYVVSAVLADPDSPTPKAATRSIQLVRIPNGSPFLIGPILGREASAPRGGSGKRADSGMAFEPLLEAQASQGEELQSLTLVCVTGAQSPIDVTQVARSVANTSGSTVENFNTDRVQLPGQGRTHCHELLDAVKTSNLEPGLYEVSATAITKDQRMEGTAVEFTIQLGTQ